MKEKGPRDIKLLLQQQQKQQLDKAVLEKNVEDIILQRPSYGSRRMVAMLTRIMANVSTEIEYKNIQQARPHHAI